MQTRADRMLLLVGVAVLSVFVGGADETDEDGTRMRAPQIEVPSSHDDELTPPEDTEDWRYIVLEKSKELQVTLEAISEESRLRLRIDRASGDEVFSGETKSRGEAARVTFEQTLEPGIFYLEVSADQTASYRLTLK